MYQLSVKECLSFGWSSFKKRTGLFISVGVILLVINLIANSPQRPEMGAGMEAQSIYYALYLIGLFVSLVANMGSVHFFLTSHDNLEGAAVRDLWHPRPLWKFIGTSILIGIATLIGFILLIVPGIIVGIVTGFSTYIVIDKGLTPVAAIKESARITKGNRWNIFLLGLVLVGINILGACALLVGLFVTLPISALAVTHAYRLLGRNVNAGNVSAAPVPGAKLAV